MWKSQAEYVLSTIFWVRNFKKIDFFWKRLWRTLREMALREDLLRGFGWQIRRADSERRTWQIPWRLSGCSWVCYLNTIPRRRGIVFLQWAERERFKRQGVCGLGWGRLAISSVEAFSCVVTALSEQAEVAKNKSISPKYWRCFCQVNFIFVAAVS